MADINKIFGITPRKDFSKLQTPQRQSQEQTEDYAFKKVVHTIEEYVSKIFSKKNLSIDVNDTIIITNQGNTNNPLTLSPGETNPQIHIQTEDTPGTAQLMLSSGTFDAALNVFGDDSMFYFTLSGIGQMFTLETNNYSMCFGDSNSDIFFRTSIYDATFDAYFITFQCGDLNYVNHGKYFGLNNSGDGNFYVYNADFGYNVFNIDASGGMRVGNTPACSNSHAFELVDTTFGSYAMTVEGTGGAGFTATGSGSTAFGITCSSNTYTNSFLYMSTPTPATTAFKFLDCRSNGVAQTTVDGAGNIVTTGKITVGTTLKLKGYTVATLPAGTVGDCAYVTNALAPAWGVAVAGGGAVTVKVFYNGANWIVG